ncbi:MAG: Ig-like domain repeat protein [Labedaea sp.]
MTGVGGGPVPGLGSVSFTEGVGGPAVPGCAPVTLPAAVECVTSGLTLGSHSIVASYDGTADPNYTNADSVPLSYLVAEATPTVNLSASPAGSAQLGTSVTLTATVTGVGGGPVPSLGSVSFTEGVGGPAVPGCASVTLPATLECVTSGLTLGSHSVVATYDGTADPNYTNADSAVLSYSIGEAAPTVTLVASPAGSAGLGSPVTLTATVTGVGGGPVPSLGSVSFTEGVGGAAVPGCAPVTLPAAPVECVTSGLSGGSHGIVASYDGTADPNYTNGDSAALSYSITEASLTVILAANPPGSAQLGTSVTFTATVTGVAGGPAPSGGTVSFTEGVGGPAVPGCAAVTLPQAPQCVTFGLTVGAHDIVASYDGATDPNYTNADSDALSYSVTQAAATVTLVADPANSAQLGAQVTFTATVAGATNGPAPSGGTVSFTEGVGGPPVPGCASVALPANPVQCVTTGLTLGAHDIAASYDGTADPNYTNGDSVPLSYSVTQATPTVTLPTGQPTAAPLGAQVTITAIVAGVANGPVPIGGTVRFTVDGVVISGCASAPVSEGQAFCTTSGLGLGLGSHSIVATYDGTNDPNYTNDASDPVTFDVTKAVPTMTLTASPATSPPAGTAVTFTASVTGANGVPDPTGTVGFQVDGATIAACPAVTLPTSPVCTPPPLPAGTHTIVAAYGGDADYLIRSATITGYQITGRTAAVSLVGSPPSPAEAGAAVTFTATVTGDSSGIPPTGTVRFTAGALNPIPGCDQVPVGGGGQATCSTTALPAGVNGVVAAYSGDAVYGPSSGALGGYVVNPPLAATGTELALTGTGGEGFTDTDTDADADTELANTGAGIDRLLLGALLLLGAGAGFVAFGAALSGRRRTQRPLGGWPARSNRR